MNTRVVARSAVIVASLSMFAGSTNGADRERNPERESYATITDDAALLDRTIPELQLEDQEATTTTTTVLEVDELDLAAKAIENNHKVEDKTDSTTTTVTPQSSEDAVDLVSEWDAENSIKREALFEGSKVADVQAVNPDGTVVVDIPLFAVMDIDNSDASEPQLERGAILEVTHPDINPEDVNPQVARPITNIPGGSVEGSKHSIIFGHRMTPINPDVDGDFANGNEGAEQTVFERIDELQPGAILEIKLTEEAGAEVLRYEFLGIRIIENFELESGGTLISTAYDLRNGTGVPSTDASSTLSLVACTPKGSTRDRIVVDWALLAD